MSQPSVYVTIPNGDGWLHKLVMFCAIKLLKDRRFKVRLDAPTHRPLENNQAHCVRDFLKGGEDFWLSIDADNPITQNPLDDVFADKDVVGFPTPVWHYTGEKPGERPIYWNMYREVPGGYTEFPPAKGLVEVDAIGGGAFLIARRVFEDPVMQLNPFRRTTDEFGRVEFGNDIAFSRRCRERGFRLWADFDRPCQHFVELELTEAIRAFNGVRESAISHP